MIGIWVNLGALYKVWPDQAAGYEATVLLGISALINLATGANRYIIINSRWYRFDLYANIFLLTLAISLNYFLIPVLKETGAAIATTIAIVLYNIVCTWYVHYRFGVQPFDQRTVKAVAIGAVAWLAGMLVPGVDFPLADMFVRGTVVTLLFIGPVLLLGLSPDLNQVAERWAGKIRGIKK
ncbi:MAG: polysaccharide biosynthesis protein [Bacteroidetes bacterium]|nr:MAG: polysaccharide biosynthesis protein [Bacteroidota bacterium]